MYTYEDGNKGIQKCFEYFKSIENVWGKMRNLKLYDVFFEAENILKKFPLVSEQYSSKYDDVFHAFCDMSYQDFVDWMKEEGIKDERVYIRRTSSFYLTDVHDKTDKMAFQNVLDHVYAGNVTFDKDLKVEPFTWSDSYSEKELIEHYQNEMEYLANGDFQKDIEEYFKDAVKIAEYLDSFQENQIQYFTEWLQETEEYLEAEREEMMARQYEIDTATMACYI